MSDVNEPTDPDVMFNLVSFKHIVLAKELECDNCHIKTTDWFVIGTCHHRICLNCKNVSISTCPKCNIEFDLKKDVSTSSEMFDVYYKMEELVWNVMALNKEKLPEVPFMKLENKKEEGSSSKKSSKTVNHNLPVESKSEEDIIEGTPDKCLALNPASSTAGGIDFVQPRKKMFLSHSCFDFEDLEIFHKFVNYFNIEADSLWSDSCTHLIVKSYNGKLRLRTMKIYKALLSHRYIVSFDWIIDCLSSKSILPEIDYVPLDHSGQPGALTSWKVGQGLIESPLKWAKYCILFFHSSVKSCVLYYPEIIDSVKKAGFVLADSLKKFNKTFKMRFILFDPQLSDFLENAELQNWAAEYDAYLLSYLWPLDCIGQYRFVPFNSKVKPL